MKKLVFSILLISALFSRELPFPWVVYEDQIRYYLDGKTYEIDGKFYSYDFDSDGKIDYNDWLYISKGGSVYRLFGIEPTNKNRFGWQAIELPQDFRIKGEFQGYYLFIDYPNDNERIYSWIYMSKNGNIYKLISNRLSEDSDTFIKRLTFAQLDLLTASIENERISFSFPMQLPPFRISTYTIGEDIEKIEQLKNFNSFVLGYQKFTGEWIRVASKEFFIPLYLMGGNEWKSYFETELRSFQKELESLFSRQMSYADAILRLRNQGEMVVFKNFAKITNWNRYKHDVNSCGQGLPGAYELMKFDSNINAIITPVKAKDEIFQIISHSSLPDLVIEPIKVYKGCLIVYSHQTGCDAVDGHIFANSFDLLCRIYKEE